MKINGVTNNNNDATVSRMFFLTGNRTSLEDTDVEKKNIYHCKTEFTLETPLTILAVNFGLMNMRTSQTKFEENIWQITLDINLHFTAMKVFFYTTESPHLQKQQKSHFETTF